MSELPNPQTSPAPVTFEQSLMRLEQIVQQLENGRVDLDAALSGYEEGIRLLRQCHGLLERAERKIELLSGVDADGKPVTAEFDDRSTISLGETAPARSRRRSTKKPAAAEGACEPAAEAPSGDVDETGKLF
jgi:exodeoxyribonuclease VII small subunit